MKFYVHCENPELTSVFAWEDTNNKTIQDVCDIFCQNLRERYPTKISDNPTFIIMNMKRKQLCHSDPVQRVVQHMDDLYITVTLKQNTENVTMLHLSNQSTKSPPMELSPILQQTSVKLEDMNNEAIIHFCNERYREALSVYKKMLKVDSKSKSALKGVVMTYLRAGRSRDALQYAIKGLQIFSKDVEFHRHAAEAYIGCSDGDSALGILLKCVKIARNEDGLSTDEKHNIQVLFAKAYLLKDQKDMALAVLQGVLRENLDHDEAVVEYAALLFPLGPKQSEEAMTAILASLARSKTDNAKSKFAALCTQPDGMKVLKSVAGSAFENVPALVYLGTCLRDFSAIEQALQLFSLALQKEPFNCNVALIYIHTLELLERHSEIVAYVKQFCNSLPEHRIGIVSCALLKRVLSLIPVDLKQCKQLDALADVSIQRLDRNYTDDERYFLAFLFTLVKVLFVKGLLLNIPPLLNLLQPCYEGRELHLTNIRNEAAYFNCISELFKIYEDIPGTCMHPSDHVIYFIGDSHCIPAAWQTITIQDYKYTIHPVLSTGTKIWHLRPESSFYPKVNFYSAIKSIPDGANVTVCLGEIDCREAVWKCWEKARYDTMVEAMQAVIEIYLQVLKSLQLEHQWRLFVHPVLPVLDVTRPIVMQFNRILATMLQRESSICWLNFVNQILTDNGEKLKEEYIFDGTHIHPRYLTLFAKAWSQHI